MSRSAHRRRVSFIMRRGNRKCIRIRFRVIHGDIVHMTLRCRLGRRPSVFVVVPVGGGGVGSDIIERLQVMATEPLLRNRAVDPSNLVPNRSTSESIDAKRLARTLGRPTHPFQLNAHQSVSGTGVLSQKGTVVVVRWFSLSRVIFTEPR